MDTSDKPVDSASETTPSQAWWRRQLNRCAYSGMVVAVVLLLLSLTPSLLPRGPLFQGVVSGGSAAVGYALGVFGAWLAGFMMSRTEPWPSPNRWWWMGLGAASAVCIPLMFYWFSVWQSEVRNLMGVEHLRWTAYPTSVVITIVVFVLLMSIGQAWGALVRFLVGKLNKIAPPRVSAFVGFGIVVAITVAVLNGVVARYSMEWLNNSFAAVNEETTADSTPPTSTLRSGGPGSYVSWGSLGRQGRIFVSNGPDQAALQRFSGAPAMEPIRAYAGLGSGENLRSNAELAAAELERAGGLDRAVVAVASSTGTGWINRATVDSIEYMYNGDTATVSMQYSYLPSWLSFLVDQERARQAGQALFEAVSKRVSDIPEAQRPKLVVFGESLGSFGGESAFGTIPDVAARTDGALFVGPTFNNTLWDDTSGNRDPGSPEWLPIYENGEAARFIAEKSDLDRPVAPWEEGRRVVYLQHASDPIAWWSPNLILQQPDWLREDRGRDVLPSMQWIPFVTFLQVSADMAVATGVPDGHGHNYLSAIPYAWSAILLPPGWTDLKTEELLPLLSRD